MVFLDPDVVDHDVATLEPNNRFIDGGCTHEPMSY